MNPVCDQAVLVDDAVAAAQGQVLGEDREVGQLVRVDQLGELGRGLAAAAGAAMPCWMAFSNWPLLIMS